MKKNSLNQIEPRPERKPLRFKIGVGLLILYPLMYLIIPIASFLPVEAGVKAAIIIGVLGAAEVVLLLGIAGVGKETYQAIKAKLGLGRKKNAATDKADGAEHSPASVKLPEGQQLKQSAKSSLEIGRSAS